GQDRAPTRAAELAQLPERLAALLFVGRILEPGVELLHGLGIEREAALAGEVQDQLALAILHHAVGPRDLDRRQQADQQLLERGFVDYVEVVVEHRSRDQIVTLLIDRRAHRCTGQDIWNRGRALIV